MKKVLTQMFFAASVSSLMFRLLTPFILLAQSALAMRPETYSLIRLFQATPEITIFLQLRNKSLTICQYYSY